MIKKSIASLVATSLVLTMSGCLPEDTVADVVTSSNTGSSSYTTTDFGNGSFEINFVIDNDANAYKYHISDESAADELIDSAMNVVALRSTTLTCNPQNEQDIFCTDTFGLEFTFTPNSELYLYRSVYNVLGSSITFNNRLETITIDGIQ